MNLRLRQITASDLEMVLEWRTMPEVSRYMFSDIEPDMDQQREWFDRIQGDDSRHDWIIEVDGSDVGVVSLVGIDHTNKRCEWAYYLASPEVRGRGIGRAVELNILEFVFDVLGLNKLCGEILAFNQFVVDVHQKYGSKVEGRRREHAVKNGVFHDVIEIGIVRSDYDNEVRGRFEFDRAEFETPGDPRRRSSEYDT